jgi:hypothetical protein
MAMPPKKALTIVGADCKKGHKLIVEYSDGTTAVYSDEQLRDLKPQQTASADSKLPGSK